MIIPNIWENKIDVPNHQPALLLSSWVYMSKACWTIPFRIPLSRSPVRSLAELSPDLSFKSSSQINLHIITHDKFESWYIKWIYKYISNIYQKIIESIELIVLLGIVCLSYIMLHSMSQWIPDVETSIYYVFLVKNRDIPLPSITMLD